MKIGYYSGIDKRNNVVSFLKEHAETQPNQTAFLFKQDAGGFKHNAISYEDFYNRVKSVAAGLKQQNVDVGDRIIVFLPISVELYIAIAALQSVGAIPVFIDSWARAEHIAAAVMHAEPRGIISVSRVFQLYGDFFNSSTIDLRVAVGDGAPSGIVHFDSLEIENDYPITPVQQEDTALITYTTGSSGEPKGANRTHRFLSAQHYLLKKLFPYEKDDIDLPVFPVFTLNNIASGITTVIPDVDISKPSFQDSEILYHQAKECNVSTMTLSPSSFKNFSSYCRKKDLKLSGVRRVLTGGAPISETDIRNFNSISPGSKNWVLYGSTEVEPIACIESSEMLSSTPNNIGCNVTEIGVNVGKVDPELQHTFIQVTDEDIKEGVDIKNITVAPHEVGELIVSGEYVCKDYYKNAKAFHRAKIKDNRGVIWHRTGDVARIDKEGYIWVVGRVHNTIIYDGKYFFPVRPEILLKDLPGVANAAYVSASIGGKDTILATVVLNEGVNEREAKEAIQVLFKHNKIPLDIVICLDDIPMDVRHHSKVDYKQLRGKLHELFV